MAEAYAFALLAKVSDSYWRPQHYQPQRGNSRFFQSSRRGAEDCQPGGPEDLHALALRTLSGATPAQTLRRREFQLLRQDLDRSQGIASPLEALRLPSGWRPGRSP